MISHADRRAPDLAGDFWAITSYFNPLAYRSRYANYRVFRERLGVPLLAVELAFGPDFELDEGDADILIQLRGGDVLWHKERLLNIALDALPAECTKVAWIDCDLLFDADDWSERAGYLLDRFPAVQLFSRVHYLPPEATLDVLRDNPMETCLISVASAIGSGLDARTCFDEANERVHGRNMPGLAWAARREVLERHRFYDACVIGGGDRAISSAFYGCFDHPIRRHSMSERQAAHYLAWAKPVYDAVRAATSFVEGELFHLWHGPLKNRRWYGRYQPMPSFLFDPFEDIALTENGLWRWNSHKPDLHAYVREHFALRREDD